VPVYDYAAKKYLYFKPNPEHFQVTVDPTGTSAGIWSVKDPNLRNVLVPGGDITYHFSPINNQLMLDVNRRYIVHRVMSDPPPELGSICEDLGAEILTDALYKCRVDQIGNYGTWVKILIQDSPTVPAP
jgi:hypothetical protein